MDYLFGILCDNKCVQLISVNPRDAGTTLKMMQKRRGAPEVFTTLWVFAFLSYVTLHCRSFLHSRNCNLRCFEQDLVNEVKNRA